MEFELILFEEPEMQKEKTEGCEENSRFGKEDGLLSNS